MVWTSHVFFFLLFTCSRHTTEPIYNIQIETHTYFYLYYATLTATSTHRTFGMTTPSPVSLFLSPTSTFHSCSRGNASATNAPVCGNGIYSPRALPPPPPCRQGGRDRAAAAARAAAEPVQHHPRPGPAVPRPGGVLPLRREPVAADPGRGARDGGQLRALRAVPADLCGGEPAGPPAARRPVSGGWERGGGREEGERERALLVRSEEELHSQIDCGDTVIQLTNLSKDTSDRARDIIQFLSTPLKV